MEELTKENQWFIYHLIEDINNYENAILGLTLCYTSPIPKEWIQIKYNNWYHPFCEYVRDLADTYNYYIDCSWRQDTSIILRPHQEMFKKLMWYGRIN